MKRTAAVLVVLILAPLAFARGRVVRSVLNAWHAPRCESVGLPWLRFIDESGVRRASSVDPEVIWRQETLTTTALAIGGAPNTLWAITSDGNIHQSVDAGCTWSVRASVPEIFAEFGWARLAARHPDRVYAYMGKDIVRLTGGTVETFHMPDDLVLLEVNRNDALHVRAITHLGFAYESLDGAAIWTKVGTLLNELVSAAFDPENFDHIVAGGKWGGLRVSRDGGKTWTDGPLRTQTINNITFSPADPRVMWVDTWPGGVGVPSRLYKSTDGGNTLVQVDSNSRSVFYWGRLFAPHPRDAGTFATHAMNGAGIKITGPAGTRHWIWENVQDAVWSPSGTLYFVQAVNEAR